MKVTRLFVPTLALTSIALLAGCIEGKPAVEDAPGSATPSSKEPSISAEDWAKGREAAGMAPRPDATTRRAYLDALNAIDPRIIKPNKEDQAVSRGLNQCDSIKNSPDGREELARVALIRFTVDTRLPEISTPETGEKITDAVHKHLCPDF